jgi:hypothetical protein
VSGEVALSESHEVPVAKAKDPDRVAAQKGEAVSGKQRHGQNRALDGCARGRRPDLDPGVGTLGRRGATRAGDREQAERNGEPEHQAKDSS